MGEHYNENGEVIEFVAHEEEFVRGVFRTGDRDQGRIEPSGGDEPVSLASLIGDHVTPETGGEEADGEEHRFHINIDIYEPTGEFRESEKDDDAQEKPTEEELERLRKEL